MVKRPSSEQQDGVLEPPRMVDMILMTLEGAVVGSNSCEKAFLLYNPSDQITVPSVNVKFDPSSFPCRPRGCRRIVNWNMDTQSVHFESQPVENDKMLPDEILSVTTINDNIAPAEQ
jgi:hypothetical protein